MSWSTRTAVCVALATTGCATFGRVQSAEVRPGFSASLQGAVSTPLGDEAGWFYAFDCAERCDTRAVGADVGLSYGWPETFLRRPATLGVGTSGPLPYAEGYAQLRGGRVPLGVGARVGLPVFSWRQHHLAARVDVPIGGRDRLLLDPGFYLMEGTAPNGDNRGTVAAFTQGVGVLIPGERADAVPSLTVVAGRARHDSHGASGGGPARTVFATASLTITFHRRRTP